MPLYCFDEPAFLPHVGQAPMPWPFRTFSAILICSPRLALFAVLAYLPPPYAFHVLRLNCRPP